jgi:hypothetical protein
MEGVPIKRSQLGSRGPRSRQVALVNLIPVSLTGAVLLDNPLVHGSTFLVA